MSMEKMIDVETILTEDQESYLTSLSNDYFDAVNKKKSFENVAKGLGECIKEFLLENKIKSHVTSDGLKLTVSSTPNTEVDEEGLIMFLKNSGNTSAIKTVETVDYDELETLIRTNVISKESVAEFSTKKPDTVRLNCTKQKDKESKVILG